MFIKEDGKIYYESYTESDCIPPLKECLDEDDIKYVANGSL